MRNKFSDNEIISALEKGDNQGALSYLYKRCFPKVKKYIQTNSGNTEDALDIFQDAILILCKQIKQEKFDRNHDIDGFVFSVSRNLWINKVKKDNRQVPLADPLNEQAQYTDFSDFIITPQREKMVKSILEKLGKKCVELLQYSMYHKLSNREIIEKMEFASENAIKTQKYKCKQKLIGIMENYPAVKELID